MTYHINTNKKTEVAVFTLDKAGFEARKLTRVIT